MAATHPRPLDRARASGTTHLIAFGLGIIALDLIAFRFFRAGPWVAFWPAAGLAVGVLGRARRDRWIVLVLVLLVANVIAGLAVERYGTTLVLVAILGKTAEPVAIAWLLDRRRPVTIDRPSTVLRLAGASVLVAAVIDGAITAFASWRQLSGDATVDGWAVAVSADVVGVMAVAPLVIARGGFLRPTRTWLRYGGVLTVAVLAGIVFAQGSTSVFLLPYLPLAAGVVLAGFMDVEATAASVAALATVALATAATGAGFFWDAGDTTLSLVLVAGGGYVAVAAASMLVTATAAAHRYRRATAAIAEHGQFRRLLEQGNDVLYRVELHPLRFVFVSDNIDRILGVPADAIYEDPHALRTLLREDDRAVVEAWLGHPQAWVGESMRLHYRLADGRELTMDNRFTVVEDGVGRAVAVEGIARDVSELANAEGVLAHQAHHDPLTGLPNRSLFFEHLARSVGDFERHRTPFGVLIFDVDRFKAINDSLGHLAGDELLVRLTRRVSAILRPTDVLARFGGDEFVALVHHPGDEFGLVAVAQRILEVCAAPIELEGQLVRPAVSVGIASGIEDGDISAQDLLRHADAALYRAKAQGRNRFELFDASLRDVIDLRVRTEGELRHALERDELVVHYQPEVDLATGTICGVEALVRWQHPTRGLLRPDQFLPIAEDTGLMGPIGRWVFEQACRQQRLWAATLARPIDVAVNLAPQQLTSPALAQDLARIVDRTGADPTHVCVEVTETALLHDPEHAGAQLQRLRDDGLRVAIDDFGTGYSSLSYLKALPVDTIKIDTSFVEHVDSASEDKAIVTAIINLADALHLAVIAEGVETSAQAETLRLLGCATAQGYLYARPQPAASLTAELLRSSSSVDERRRRPERPSDPVVPGRS